MKTFRVFFLRELHVALLNRLILTFCGIALIAGSIPAFGDRGRDLTQTALFALLQAGLYLFPLFAILIGAGSAQNENEENALLMSQPIRRGVRILGKFAALWLLIAIAGGLLIMSAALIGCSLGALGFLWSYVVAIGGVFVALGLAVGFTVGDRVKAHMVSLCLWLFLLIGLNILSLLAARLSLVQTWPETWLLILMLNPLDAFRVSIMLTLNRIPFDLQTTPALGRFWFGNLSLWFGILCSTWITAALVWCRIRLEKSEEG